MRLNTLAWLMAVVGTTGGILPQTAAALPPFAVTRLYRSGNSVSDGIDALGVINSPFGSGIYGGPGFVSTTVANGGAAYVHVNLYGPPPPPAAPNVFHSNNQAILSSTMPLNGLAPFIAGYSAAQVFGTPSFALTVPSTDYVFDEGFWMSMNNSGNVVIALRLAAFPGTPSSPLTGVYFNHSAMPIKEGDAVTAAGVAGGTTFATFGPDRIDRYVNNAPLTTMVQLNDSNVMLLACKIVESAVTKNAIFRIALDPSGSLLSETLVAKEGGPVGIGPATWVTLAAAPNTCAINNAGLVVFSGLASTGASGIYSATSAGAVSLIAPTGGATPAGSTWGSLVGAPVHVNNGGHFAFRGVVSGAQGWTEVGEAGEGFGGFSGNCTTASPQAQQTSGGGSLSLISGSLSNDQDLDVYAIQIGDATLTTQEAFSATTVPNPGAGFAGAAFDTQLWLFDSTFPNNSVARAGVGKCDDAAPGLVQSTLTTLSVPPYHQPGRVYYLAIGSGGTKVRARAGCGASPTDMWAALPGAIVTVGGAVHWVDPNTGSIGRASTATGMLLTSLPVGVPPMQSLTGVQSDTSDRPLLGTKIAAYDTGSGGAGSKLLYTSSSNSFSGFKTCNLDGTGVANVALAPSGPGLPQASGASAIAVDNANGKIYWATPVYQDSSRINRCNLDGTMNELVVAPLDPCACDEYTVPAMAIDTFGAGRVYWHNASSGTLAYENLSDLPDIGGNAATVHTVLANVHMSAMSIDSAARRLYYLTTASPSVIGVIDLSTHTVLASLGTTVSPAGVAIDATAGKLYWSNPYERMIRRTAVALPSAENWLSLGADVGEYTSDGIGATDGYGGFARFGTAGSTALPYQIKLTGATFSSQVGMICKDNTAKVAMVGDTLPSGVVANAGYPQSAVRISDRSVVGWAGVAGSSRGLFADTTMLLTQDTVPTGGGSAIGFLDKGAGGFAMSASGQYLTAYTGAGTAAAGESVVVVAFASLPGCQPDFNGDGILSVQDIFDFLNAWFAGNPSADYNGIDGLSVQDIFDFLNGWFAGC